VLKVLTGTEMQELDRRVIDGLGIPGEVLMERAGLGVAEATFLYFPPESFPRALVLCGPGNNGGDGMVCARHLIDSGYAVKVILLCDEEKYKGEAKKNLLILKRLSIDLKGTKTTSEFKKEVLTFAPNVIVDAVFGTGLKREVKGFYAEVIEEVNNLKEEGIKVVSVDIPSGVDSATGQVLGIAVKADVTVTFELPKLGHYFYPGKAHTGVLRIVRIGFPKKVVEEFAPSRVFLDDFWARNALKSRTGYVHKGTFGHVAVIAGSRGKSGACFLSALGALRIGAGLVTIICPQSLQPIFASMLPEALTIGVEENENGEVSSKAIPKILEAIGGKRAVVLGPGIGLSEEVKEVVFKVLQYSEAPVVLDADGLTLVSTNPSILKEAKSGLVLTPHPGEAERLLKTNKAELLRDRLSAVRRLSELVKKGVAILKGPHTVVKEKDGREAVSSIDEPGLAQGGNGDVLSGLIAGLIAQKYELFEATCLGVFLHGAAGRLLKRSKGDFGFLASEVASAIPRVVRGILNGKTSSY